MEGGGLYSRLFPEKADAAECACPDPDWDAIHRELRKTGVTLGLLHGEHADAPRAEGRPWMSYDRFCKRYAGYAERRNVASRVGHKAGRTLEADWAGPTMQLVDPMSGEVPEPAIQQILLCQADAGHEAGYMAALPCACLRLLRGGARQSSSPTTCSRA